MIGSEIFRRPSLLKALLRPGARQVNDRSAAAEHNWSRFRDTDLPAGLQLQWLGAAGQSVERRPTT